MHLPQDPIMLFSVVNMKLRDQYDSLDALCEDYDISRKEVEQALLSAGFEYDEKTNQFI